MTKPNIPVYFEEFQSLVLCRLDSLVIDINNYEQNTKVLTRFRSSSQRRLRGLSELLRHQCRITAQGRWLQGSRPYLDELKSTACLHRWTVRQPHTRQRQRRQNPQPTTACLTQALHATQSGDSTSPFLSPRLFSFHLPPNFPLTTYETKQTTSCL